MTKPFLKKRTLSSVSGIWFVCFRSCGSSKTRRQNYRRSVMSRNKPSRKWVCTSASKKPTPLVCHPHQGHQAHLPLEGHASLPTASLEPQACVLLSKEGRAIREACQQFGGNPCPGCQASGTQHWLRLINSSRTAFCGDRKSYGHRLSVCVPGEPGG